MYFTYVETPIGRVLLAGDGGGLAMSSFSTGHQQRQPEPEWIPDGTALEPAVTELEEYFAGERTTFDVELSPSGSEFQQSVWKVLRSIPFGEAWSYGEVAERLGRPGAARAVGSANAANSLPIFIPCHRVVGADGGLTGFGGGLDTKRWLLRFEGALPTRKQGSLF